MTDVDRPTSGQAPAANSTQTVNMYAQLTGTIDLVSRIVGKGSGPASQIIGASLLLIAFGARLWSCIDNPYIVHMVFTQTDFAIVAAISLLLFWSGSALRFYAYREALLDERIVAGIAEEREKAGRETLAKLLEKRKPPKL